MEQNKKLLGIILIIVTSVLWGTALLYSKYVLDSGISSKDLVSLKMFFGFITIFIFILIKDKSLFKIDKKGIIYSATIGFICHALYNLFMFNAIEKTTIATTVTLLYTSPIFVMIGSKFLFKEEINTSKIIALISCVIGCFLTVTGGNLSTISLDAQGLLYGILSGICYAIMTLLNKKIANEYEQVTILTYTFGFAFLFSLSFSNPITIFKIPFNPLVYTFVVMLGVLSTSLSYLLYIKGLSYGVEPSKASIIAALEVPVSVVGSFFIFNQRLIHMEVVGILLVLISVLILNEEFLLNIKYCLNRV